MRSMVLLQRRCAVCFVLFAFFSSQLQVALAGGAKCKLGPYIRPIILVAGFSSNSLFNSSDSYSLVWQDPADFGPNPDPNAPDDFFLPLTWDAATLTQDGTPVGPEAFPGDVEPDFLLPDGTLTPYLQPVFSDIVSIARGWERSPRAKGTRLLYTAAYDWRRDLREQSARLAKVIDTVYEETGCKAIIVSHSFGGLVAYSAFARFGKKTADKVQGVLYGAGTLQPTAVSLAVFIFGQPGFRPFDAPELQFSYTSLFGIVPAGDVACTNGPALLDPAADPTATRACMPGEIPTGITCKSEACGRPADWPEDAPFFLGLDLTNPLTWQAFGIGLPIARALRNETNVLYSPEELAHIGFAMTAAERMMDDIVGSGAADVAAIHPPAVALSLALTTVQVPGRPAPEVFFLPTSLECVPAPTFGQFGQVQCLDFVADEIGPGDGLLPTSAVTVKDPSIFGDKLQVVISNEPSPFWLQAAEADPDLFFSPHFAILQGRFTPSDSFVDCAEFSATLPQNNGSYPSMESMICSLVLQGDEEDDDEGKKEGGRPSRPRRRPPRTSQRHARGTSQRSYPTTRSARAGK